MTRAHRGTIFVDEGAVLAHECFPGAQYITRIHAPDTARHARPGSFAHVTCDPAIPMRRPLSIMRADATAGWIEVLYKVVGSGLAHLAARPIGAAISVLGPIGKPFTVAQDRPLALLIGGGVGIPPMVFLAETMRDAPASAWQPLVLMGSEIPFPFATRASQLALETVPAQATHAMTFLDDLGIASRLASAQGYAGCYNGFVTELAAQWLAALTPQELQKVCIYACGPTPMLAACAQVAHRFGVPAQVSLEEFMACAVGGCAGCAVPVYSDGDVAMKRVCVDGPVFDAYSVFPQAGHASQS